MVSYAQVETANHETFLNLPAGVVAVFVGATNGIGEYTLRQFAKQAKDPRVYFIGRSQEAGSRIAAECSAINGAGSFTFIQADTSLIRNVDKICQEIKSKESAVNLLFLSTGTLDFYTYTSEGLPLAAALIHYSRARFIHNLLPELQAADRVKRVVSVFAGTKEGALYMDDIHAKNVPFIKARGHAASLVTAGMMTLARQAPDVSFIHTFPGPVKSGIGRDMPGIVGILVRSLGTLVGPIFNIPTAESGAYHLYFSTSSRYCAKETAQTYIAASENGNAGFARAVDGSEGGGIYCVDQTGESASSTVEELLAGLERDGNVEKVWGDLQDTWKRLADEGKHAS